MAGEKEKFVMMHEIGKFTMTELCIHFGISRVTGYRILDNYARYGSDIFNGISKSHKAHPFTTLPEIEQAILQLRKRHKTWGAKKLHHLLLDDWRKSDVPSVTTVNHILKKHGLTKPRKRRLNRVSKTSPRFDPKKPNEIWSADFKGKFRMQNKEYIHPLTIADSKSRYVFAVEALENANTALSKPVFDRAFRKYGLPDMMHTDNGSPFGCVNALRRMTALSVWFMDLGITPVYSDPGCPTQNGRHERMHRDLKAEATRPPGRNQAHQQRMFDKFINDYNTIRPHEALDMRRPRQVHEKSNRIYTGKIDHWDYESKLDVRMVTANGNIRWKRDIFPKWIPVGTSLSGRMVGIIEVREGIYELYYRHVLLGYFSEQTGKTYEIENFNL